jgi:hypothetical protein
MTVCDVRGRWPAVGRLMRPLHVMHACRATHLRRIPDFDVAYSAHAADTMINAVRPQIIAFTGCFFDLV